MEERPALRHVLLAPAPEREDVRFLAHWNISYRTETASTGEETAVKCVRVHNQRAAVRDFR